QKLQRRHERSQALAPALKEPTETYNQLVKQVEDTIKGLAGQVGDVQEYTDRLQAVRADWHTGCKAMLNTDLTDADRATKVAALMGGVEEKLTRISEDIDNLQGDKDRLQQMKDAAAAADTARQKGKAFHKSCDNVEEKIALLEADDPAAAATYAAALA